MDNAGDCQPCGKGACQDWDHIVTTNTFATKACGYLKFKVDPLTLTHKKSFTFWDVRLVMTLHVLERLKQSSSLNLIIIKGNTYLFETEKRMYHRSVFIHIMYKIATNVLMIRKSLPLRSVKRKNNLKKGKLFGNTNWNTLPTSSKWKRRIFILITHSIQGFSIL